MLIGKIVRMLRRLFAENILYQRFPVAYAHYYYWRHTGRELNLKNPQGISQKMLWLACFWQDSRIVRCTDKLAVREYIIQCGLEDILNEIYFIYDNAADIDITKLPSRFVLKTNHFGGGDGVFICKNKKNFNINGAKRILDKQMHSVTGLETCEWQYQYIKPKLFAEKYIGDENDNRLEIQFFCFNGKAKHILVRNDLGDAAATPFAISYDTAWNRMLDRKEEVETISIPRPHKLDEMIRIANILSSPFPQVRVDLYYVDERIIFGEMTFSTCGNILLNYKESTRRKWGEELSLPSPLKSHWGDYYKSYASK